MKTRAERQAKRHEMNQYAASYMKKNPGANRSELDKAMKAKFKLEGIWQTLLMAMIQAILDLWFPTS